ncbi:MAG: histidine triad nucleotide-binding protein [Candidatus Nanopelagicales bacterium]|nr:histidine triad nucleotide-binding protein [Candidatus Nanopelagicales bacterium]
MSDCLFCAIASGDIPATVVYSDDQVVVFRDLNPQAPTHVLAIPRTHYTDAAALATAEPELAGALLAAVGKVARAEGLADGYRVVFNTGSHGGQTVDHVHAHLLGGRQLTWPPG